VVEPFLDTLIVGQAIARSGNETQQSLLDGVIDGSRIVALAHGEPDSHYELSRVTTRAQCNGGTWQLNGEGGGSARRAGFPLSGVGSHRGPR
jgi:Acyl-CoA dehydrogenases